MSLFSYYPKTYYSFSNTQNNLEKVTNIFSRFIIDPKLKTNTAAYYWYTIQEGETPESIAHKIYGSPFRYWILLQFNDILNVSKQWPMSYETLISYLDNKYKTQATELGISGSRWSRVAIHSYYLEQTETINGNSTVYTIEITEEMSNNSEYVGQDGSDVTADGELITFSWRKFNKTFYDFEMEENENLRRIKILKPEFISSIEATAKALYN